MPYPLTDTEKTLLHILLDEKPHDRAELIRALGGTLPEDLNCLRAHLSNLRNKLGPDYLIVSQENTLHTRDPESVRKRLQGAYRLVCIAGPTLPPERVEQLRELLGRGRGVDGCQVR